VQNTILKYANRKAEEISGYKVEELVNTSFEEFIHPDELDKVVDRYKRRMAGEDVPSRYETSTLHKNGSKVHIALSVSIITYQDEVAELAFIRDVTEQKRAKEELKKYRDHLEELVEERTTELEAEMIEREEAKRELEETDRYLKNLIDSSPNIIVSVDKDRNIVEFNKSAEEAFGYSRDEVIGSHINLVYSDREQGRIVNKKIMEEEEFEGEVTNKRRNGEIFISHLFASPLYNEEGDIEGIIGISHDITESKRVKMALQESEERFKTLVANIPGATYRCVYDSDWAMEYISSEIENISGYPSSDFINNKIRTYTSVIHPDDAQMVEEVILEGVKNKQPFTIDYRVIHADGSIHHVYERGQGVFNEQGKVVCLDGAIFDITERKLAEDELSKYRDHLDKLVVERTAELAESEERHKSLYNMVRLMADNMTDMLWAKDMDNRYIFANKAICENLLNARDIDEPIGKTDMFFAERERESHPDDPNWHTFGEICADSDSIVKKSKKPERFDEFGNVKGEFLYMDVHRAPIFDEEGNMIGVVGSARDVTREKKLEEEREVFVNTLQESEEKFKNLFQFASDAIFVENLEGEILAVNRYACELHGYKEEELIRLTISDVVPPETSENFSNIIKALKKEKGFLLESLALRKDGSVFPTEVSGRLVPWGDGEAVLIFMRDITERKRAERIESVLYNIANSVNTTDNLNELFKTIQENLDTIIDTTNFFIALYDEEKDILKFPYFIDEKDSFTEVPAENTTTHYVIRTGKPLLATPDVFEKLYKEGEIYEEGIGTPAKIWLGAPLKRRDEVFGVVAVQSYSDPDAYDEDDKELLQFVSDQIAIAIDEMRGQESLRKSEEKSRGLFDTTRVITRAYQFDEMIELIGNEATRLLGADECEVMLIDEEREVLKSVFYNGDDYREEVFAFELSLGEGLSGYVALTGQPSISNYDNVLKISTHIPGTPEEEDESIISVPLEIGHKVEGVMTLRKYERRKFTEEELETLTVFATQASLALEKVRIINNLKKTADELKESEEKYRTLVDNINIGIYRNTPGDKGKFIDVNPAFMKIFGYDDKNEILELVVSDLYINPEQRKRINKKLLKDSYLFEEEIVLKRKSGVEFWGSVIATAVEDNKGNIIYYDGIVQDITKRKLAEERIKSLSEIHYLVAESLLTSSTVPELSQSILSGLQKIIDFDIGEINLSTADRERGEEVARVGVIKELDECLIKIQDKKGLDKIESPSLKAVEEDNPIFINDARTDKLTGYAHKCMKKFDINQIFTIPLSIWGVSGGVLQIMTVGSKVIEEMDREVLITVSKEIGAGIAKVLSEEEIKRERERVRALSEIHRMVADALIKSGNVIELTQTILEGLCDEMNFDIGEIALIGTETGSETCATVGLPEEYDRRIRERQRELKKSVGVGMETLRTNRSIYIEDAKTEKLLEYAHDLIEEFDINQMYSIPLQMKGEAIGLLQIFANSDNIIKEDERYILDTVSKEIAAGIEKVQAEETLKRERRTLQLIAELAVRDVSVNELCKVFSESILVILGFDFGGIRLYDSDEKILFPTAITGLPDEIYEEKVRPEPLDDKICITSYIARERVEVFAPDVKTHPIYKTHMKRIEELGIGAMISLPLLGIGGRLLGVLNLISYEPMNISEEDIWFYRSVRGMFVNILERVETKIELETSRERFRDLFEFNRDMLESSPIGILRVDRDFKIIYENPEMKNLMGVPEGEESNAMGVDIRKLVSDEDTGMVSRFEELKKDNEISFETPFTSIYGKESYLSVIGVPLYESREFVGGMLLIRDILEQKVAEDRIITLSEIHKLVSHTVNTSETVEELCQGILDGLGESLDIDGGGIMLYEKDENKFNWVSYYGFTSEFMKRLREKRKEEISYTSIIARLTLEEEKSVFIDDISTNEYIAYARDIYEEFEVSSVFSVPLMIRGNALGVIQLTTVKDGMISEEDKKVLEIISNEIAAGITKIHAEEELKNAYLNLKVANIELRELDKTKTEFLNVTSHELKTPLTSIMGYSELLSDGSLGEIREQQIKAISGIERNAEKLNSLVDDLLDFARMESGGLKLDLRKCDSNAFFLTTLDEIQVLLKDTGINLIADIKKRLPAIICDSERLSQVINNLISNAIFYSEVGGKIFLNVRVVKNDLIVSVKDEGKGIPEDKLDKIFNKFYQVDMSDSRRSKGLGLGLSIAKTIVEMHNGKIWVESELNVESTFYFTIPIK